MAASSECADVLKRLGLTFNEARVFCALSGAGKATAKTISKSSGTAREVVYQVLPSLQKKGLVEEIMSVPKSFKAVSMEDAFAVLIRRRTRENVELREKAKKTLEQWQETNDSQAEDSQIVVIPPREEDSNWKTAWSNVEETVDLTMPLCKFLQWPRHYAEVSLDGIIRRKVRMRIITEEDVRKILASPPEGFSQNLIGKFRHADFRFLSGPPPVELVIFDGKMGFICTNRVSQMKDMTWLFSNNPFIVEVARGYFESLWSSLAQTHKSELPAR